MKKTYFAPEFEEVKINMQNAILAGSGGTSGGDDPEPKDPNPDYNEFD